METVLEPKKDKKATSKLRPKALKYGRHIYHKVIVSGSTDNDNETSLFLNLDYNDKSNPLRKRGVEEVFRVKEYILELENLSEEFDRISREGFSSEVQTTKSVRIVKATPSLFSEPDHFSTRGSAKKDSQESTDIFESEEYYKTDSDTLLAQLEVQRNTMKRLLPVSLAIWAALFLILSSAFLTILFISLKLKIVIINPWYLFPLAVGSVGLLATVLIAVHEWRKSLNATQKKNK